MATVSNTLRMKDSMGSVLKSVITSMNMTISTMERMNSASDNIDLSSDFEAARKQIGLATNQLSVVDDEIRKAANEQDNFNNKIRDGTYETNSLKSMFISLGGAIGLKKLVDTSDSMTLITARLDLINDGLQTTDELQSKIFASANDARGLYADMASSVAKLGLLAGDAFNNNNEIIAFTNLFQKMGTISGSSSSEISNAMYQLNQAMASGRLQGDEYRSIIENAPMLAQAISDYMKVGRDELKEMSSDGLITAEIIKGAMFSVADEVNEKFKNMPMTWGQFWNGAINNLLVVSQPLLDCINLLANNWSTLEPIVLVAASAVAAYASIMLVTNSINAIAAIQESVKAASLLLSTGLTVAQTAATRDATGAQLGLNAAILANPMTWIIVGIVAAIALVIYALIKWQEYTASVVGFIFGVVSGLYSFIFNIIATLVNLFFSFSDFLSNLFIDPVAAVKVLFLDMAISVLGYFNSLATSLRELVNLIPGMDIDTAGGFDGWIDSLEKVKQGIVNDKGLVKSNRWEYDSMGSMADKGYNLGHSLSLGVSDKLSGVVDKIMGRTGMPSTEDLMAGLGEQEFDVKVKDDVNLADESMKFLLDAVTQKYINNINLQAPAPNVQVLFTGEINRDVDYDELAEITKKKLGTEMVEYAMSSTDIRR